jgi:signal transduction histidine kinase
MQVLREALHNTQKHSNASRVLIAATRRNGSVEFTVQDDGRGFPFSGSFSLQELNALRLGPESIKRRVEELKGDLRLDSKPGKGSRLEIRLPI